METLRLTRFVLLAVFLGSGLASAAEADLRTLVRGGCPDETDCCFGKWKVKTAAPVYASDDAIDKVGAVVPGQEVEALSGRVHSEPGRLKVLFRHGEWKAGQTIGLYREPDENGKARIGTAARPVTEEVPLPGRRREMREADPGMLGRGALPPEGAVVGEDQTAGGENGVDRRAPSRDRFGVPSLAPLRPLIYGTDSRPRA